MPALETPLPLLVLVAVLAYLLGSVSFGVVAARIWGLGDLRKLGSGNVGATNVLRTGNRLAAAVTLVGDAGKGAVAVLLARAALNADAAQVAGLAAILGHCFPVWLGFRGGKGVATFLGVILALSPLVGVIACALWLGVARATRISSAGALAAAFANPLLAPLMGRPDLIALAIGVAAIVALRHRTNIARLAAGTEPRIGGKNEPGG